MRRIVAILQQNEQMKNTEADIIPAGRVGESYLMPSGQVRIVGEPSTEQIL